MLLPSHLLLRYLFQFLVVVQGSTESVFANEVLLLTSQFVYRRPRPSHIITPFPFQVEVEPPHRPPEIVTMEPVRKPPPVPPKDAIDRKHPLAHHQAVSSNLREKDLPPLPVNHDDGKVLDGNVLDGVLPFGRWGKTKPQSTVTVTRPFN